MHTEEQQLIDGLFSRLKEAEQQSPERDAQAEALIRDKLARQPAAPYYMAQALIIQEAALKRLDQRVRELEAQVSELREQGQPRSGGFLGGLFGAGSRAEPRPAARGWGEAPRGTGGWSEPAPRPGYAAPAAAPAAGMGQGFLGGALQTAAGVAGGMVLGNLLMDMFHDSQPQEIVEIINETPDEVLGDERRDLAGDTGPDDGYAGSEGAAGDEGFQDVGYDEGGFTDEDDNFI